MVTIRAVLDACVIYPAALRDTLLYAAAHRLLVPSWSSGTVAEMSRNLIKDGRMNDDAAARTVAAMRQSFPTAEVSAAPIPGDLPGIPADDRHVAEAAVAAQASFLVTLNLKDFPAATLAPFKVTPIHPDDFLLMLHQQAPAAMLNVVRKQQAKLKSPYVSMEEVLQSLAVWVPRFAQTLRLALVDPPR
jgi:hypothetical protein